MKIINLTSAARRPSHHDNLLKIFRRRLVARKPSARWPAARAMAAIGDKLAPGAMLWLNRQLENQQHTPI